MYCYRLLLPTVAVQASHGCLVDKGKKPLHQISKVMHATKTTYVTRHFNCQTHTLLGRTHIAASQPHAFDVMWHVTPQQVPAVVMQPFDYIPAASTSSITILRNQTGNGRGTGGWKM